MSDCPQPQRECPWGPEQWQRMGRIEEKLDHVANQIDALNGFHKRGAAAGGVTGAIVAMTVGVAEWVWLKFGGGK